MKPTGRHSLLTQQQSSQVNCIPALLCATPGKWEGKKNTSKIFSADGRLLVYVKCLKLHPGQVAQPHFFSSLISAKVKHLFKYLSSTTLFTASWPAVNPKLQFTSKEGSANWF